MMEMVRNTGLFILAVVILLILLYMRQVHSIQPKYTADNTGTQE